MAVSATTRPIGLPSLPAEWPIATPMVGSSVRTLAVALARAGAVLSVVALAVGVPLWSSVVTGAIQVPKEDDWAFARIAFDLAETGRFRLVGWGVMAMVGHIVWAQPWLALFGRELPVLHLLNAATSALGLVVTYRFARAHLAPGRALLVTGLVAAAPGYALLSSTFMTDPTAFLGQVACLALGTAGLRQRGGRAWLLIGLGLAAGLWAATVREVAVIAPLAVLAGAAWLVLRERPRELPALAVAVGGAVMAAVAFTLWRRALPDDQVLLGQVAGPAFPLYVARSWFTAALVLGPIALLTASAGLRRHSLVLAVAAADVAVAAAAVVVRDLGRASEHTLLTGSFLTQRGAMGSSVALGQRPELYPDAVWAVVVAAALGSGILLALRLATGLGGRSRRVVEAPAPSPERVVLHVFAVGSVLAVNAYAFVGGALFDRYLWPAVLGVAVLLLSRRGPALPLWRRVAAGTWLAALAAASLLGTVEEHTYDVARWQAGEAAVARGLDPTHVDAGFEWVGWHHPGAAYRPGDLRISQPHPSYLLLFAGTRNCEVVASSPVDDPRLRLVDTLDYQPVPGLGLRTLYTYRNAFACRL